MNILLIKSNSPKTSIFALYRLFFMEVVQIPYFHFKRLIDKYSVLFVLRQSGGGHYDLSGDWVMDEPTETEMRGAIIGISEYKVYRSDGYLTMMDKELYMEEPLSCNQNLATVLYEGNKYKVESHPNDNHAFTGVYRYTLKHVSAFGGQET